MAAADGDLVDDTAVFYEIHRTNGGGLCLLLRIGFQFDETRSNFERRAIRYLDI
jgi:hypothetical protein